MSEQESKKLSRRDMLKLGLVAGGAAIIGPGRIGDAFAMSCYDSSMNTSCGDARETFPISPLIGGRIVQTTVNGKTVNSVSRVAGDFDAFSQELPIPTALRPVQQFAAPYAGTTQDSDGEVHQVGVDGKRADSSSVPNYTSTLGDCSYYRLELKVAPHNFTNQQVVPINAAGNVVRAPRQSNVGRLNLPPSTIWGFNGQFPGPMINAEYGKPCLIRIVNMLGDNNGLDSQDFGAPDRAFLTHLHNAHTAPESDGNPFHKSCPYGPGQWVDNLYLNWACDGDSREKQSFFWFHDHRMDHTGDNVYKGMVGLYPIYDPVLDSGDETAGLRLPGVRTNRYDGTSAFDVQYDIPLAFADYRLNDGVTRHQDYHSGCDETHPEWWGKTFYKHFPNKGFVGDVFTVNGVACPVLHVKRRKYRFRFLDASIARQYEFKLMRGSVGARPGQQGQYNFIDGNGGNTLGEQVMRFRQIAADGGLLPFSIDRNSIDIWPAKRREVIIDFSRYMDGSPTTNGEAIYLANIFQMLDGRKRTEPDDRAFDRNYCVPVLKFVIDGDAADNSIMPAMNQPLRPLPPLPDLTRLPKRVFRFDKREVGGELIWTINGKPFDPARIEASVKRGQPELWTFRNEGGGWTHPVHAHMEEHQVVSRDGKPVPDAAHPDDRSREDTVALEGGESVTVYRNFRTFTGKYVTHCHNLSHEDHAMMFGWEIKP